MAEEDHISDSVALEIYQTHLDVITRALFARDFETFVTRLKYPYFIRTSTTNYVVRDVVQHRRLFNAVYDGVKSEGLTDLIRIAQTAYFAAENVVVGTHISHRMRNGHRTTAPYSNRLRLERDPDGCWRETHSSTSIDHKAGKFGVLKATKHPLKAPPLYENSKGTN